MAVVNLNETMPEWAATQLERLERIASASAQRGDHITAVRADAVATAIRANVPALTAAAEALRLDAERLDWLMENSAKVQTEGDGKWFVSFDWLPAGHDRGPIADTKRAAIDAARQKEAKNVDG